MKKVVFLSLLGLLLLPALNDFAQETRYRDDDSHFRPERQHRIAYSGKPPSLFIGTSTGINNPSGFLGLDICIPLTADFSGDAGVGSSTWGTKVFLGGKYYYRTRRRRMAIGFGFSHSSGLDNFTTTLPTYYYGNEPVELNLHPQSNVYISWYRYYRLGHRANRFYVDVGYSFRLGQATYDVQPGIQLTDQGNNLVKLLCPGGLMIGCGFEFGVYRR